MSKLCMLYHINAGDVVGAFAHIYRSFSYSTRIRTGLFSRNHEAERGSKRCEYIARRVWNNDYWVFALHTRYPQAEEERKAGDE